MLCERLKRKWDQERVLVIKLLNAHYTCKDTQSIIFALDNNFKCSIVYNFISKHILVIWSVLPVTCYIVHKNIIQRIYVLKEGM